MNAEGQFIEDSPNEPEIQNTASADEKLVYMEFTDSPLSLVFKSFSEETGNNFIFPNSVEI